MKNHSKNFFFIVALLLLNKGISQKIIILDSLTREPIPFAEIFSENGNIVGITDMNGNIHKDLEQKILEQMSSFSIGHLSYNIKKVFTSDLMNSDNIFEVLLASKLIFLDEIEVMPTNNISDYILIGTYRSSQNNDSTLVYYQEGEVEYFIKSKSNGKNRIKRKFSKPKFYENPLVINNDDTFIMKTVGPNDFESTPISLQQLFDNSYDVVKLKNNHILINEEYSIIKGKDTVGTIKIKENQILLEINFILPEQPISRGLFGFEAIQYVFTRTIVYKCKSLNDMTINNIQYIRDIKVFESKKKNDAYYTIIKNMDELFVSSAQSIPDLKFKDLKTVSVEDNLEEIKSIMEKNRFFRNLPLEDLLREVD